MQETIPSAAKRRTQPLVVLLAFATSACQSPTDDGRIAPERQAEIATHSLTNQNAFTQADFSSGTCDTVIQQPKILQALAILHDQFVTNPQPILDCLKGAIIPVDSESAPTGQHAEWIMAKMTSTARTIPISCVAPINGAQANWDTTVIHIDPVVVSGYASEDLAGLIGHEAAHMFGFIEMSQVAVIEYSRSIPMQIQTCTAHIARNTNPPERLSDLTEEVALQTIGDHSSAREYTLLADRDYRTICPSLLFASGIAGSYSQDGVQAIQMSCTDAAFVHNDNSPAVGDSVGVSFQAKCGNGQVMVGIQGQAGIMVNSIGPACANVSDVQAGTPYVPVLGPTYGAENGDAPDWKRICPAGMAVRSLRGHFGVAASGTSRKINSIQVVCQSINKPRILQVAYAGGWSPNSSTLPWTSTDCSGRGAVHTLLTTVNRIGTAGIRHLNGGCVNFTGYGSGVEQIGSEYFMSGVGSPVLGNNPFDPEGTDFESLDYCQQGDVLVGVNVNADRRTSAQNPIRGIQGICAKAREWAEVSSPQAATYNLPYRGPVDGSVSLTWSCPQGMFVSGFRAQGAFGATWEQSSLGQFYVTCRSFEVDTLTFNASPQDYPAGYNFGLPSNWETITGDFNGDGRMDYARLGGTLAYVFTSNTDGTFTPRAQNYPTGFDFGVPSNWKTITGKFNADNRTDYARLGGTVAYVFTSNEDGTFTLRAQNYPAGFDFGLPTKWETITGNFNDDNRTDYARLGGTLAYVFTSNGDGTFTPRLQNYPAGFDFGLPTKWETITGNFNNDNRTDYARLGGTLAYVFTSNADGTFTSRAQNYPTGWNFGLPSSWKTITGNFREGSALTDYARLGGTLVHVFTSNGDGTFTSHSQNYPTGWNFGLPSAWETITGDFNGDGTTDYARLGGTYGHFFMSTGDGSFGSIRRYYPAGWNFGLPSSWKTITGDFNGDGKVDYARLGGTSADMFIAE
jgi:hypothetical protein